MIHDAIFSLLALAAAMASLPTATTVCNVAARPSRFDGKLLKITASVYAGVHHEMFAYDPRCDRAIMIAVPQALSDDQQVERLRTLVFSHYPAGVKRAQASAAFVGVLHIAKSGAPLRSLALKSVSNVAPENASGQPLDFKFELQH